MARCMKRLVQLPRFIREIPVESRSKSEPLGILQTHPMHVRNVGQQTHHFLAAANNAELVRLFDRVDRIASGVCETDHFSFRRLCLEQERGKVCGVLGMSNGANDLAAIRLDDSRRIPLQSMTEGIIGSDEEPGVATLLDHRLASSLGERIGIIGPMHAGRRAGFARQVGRSGGRDEKNAILSFAIC